MAYYRLYFLDEDDRIDRLKRYDTYDEALTALAVDIDGHAVELWRGIALLKRYTSSERRGPHGPEGDR
jgi:hypothetical protein